MLLVSILSLWLPILVSAVLVFVASSVIHMFLGYHAGDFKKLPNEDGVMDALRPFKPEPGNYNLPHADSMKHMASAEFKEKLNKGPVAWISVMPTGQMGMGKQFVQWFLFCLLIGVFAAYIAGSALEPGAHYLAVFRFAGTTAFAGYALAQLDKSIWYNTAWSTTLRNVFDGLIYALLTAGTFGWLWPSAI
jgi:Flp pilus assembly protein TadB